MVRLFAVGLLGACRALADLSPDQAALLPPPASHPVDFSRDIKPILEARCITCHGRGRQRGGLSIETRDSLLNGGDSGPAVVPGGSMGSYLVELVSGLNSDLVMPEKGTRLTPAQVGLLRGWIDQGMTWDKGVTFARPPPNNMQARRPDLPPGAASANPIDRFLRPYFAAHHVRPAAPVSDRIFARRVYLDVIGLLPSPAALSAFIADRDPAKREKLIDRLLADSPEYAENWMSFWNDLLRNDYGGAGYRKEITPWLYRSLATNLPYDKFVAELANPTPESAGFVEGIVWRGTINASETPQMQVAQNISQVFMGVNLKCASCHDSFINDLTLADAYGMAGIYSESALEMVRCDKPMGKKAEVKFLYPQLGHIDASAVRGERIRQFVNILTSRTDGRLTRTLVNRFWDRLMGRGLVETVDDMEKLSWNPDLLDWMAEDFADHGYDPKHVLRQILTSQAYQMPAISVPETEAGAPFTFRGPLVRRLTAEQFVDTLGQLTGIGYARPSTKIDREDGAPRPAVPPSLRRIWIEAGKGSPASSVYFAKTVDLTDPARVPFLIVSAAPRCTISVNGKEMGKERIDHYGTFELIDLSGLLVVGRNRFSVRIQSLHPENPGRGVVLYARLQSGHPALAADVETDASWTYATSEGAGWDALNLPAARWSPAVDLGDLSSAPVQSTNEFRDALAAAGRFGQVRAALVRSTSLQFALGRPGRDQVTTTRSSVASTFQALEFTNGQELAARLREGAKDLVAAEGKRPEELLRTVYWRALGRPPSPGERDLALESMGKPASPAATEDVLWAVTMLPEFQLIY